VRRILDPAQIEAFGQGALPRIRLPDRATLFSSRAQRLRELGESHAAGHAIGDYLRLMAAVADAQQGALASFAGAPPDTDQIARAHAHRMPLSHAVGWPRESEWRNVLVQVCDGAAVPRFPAGVGAVCNRLRQARPEEIETQADALLAGRTAEIDTAAAPFIMAALQVYWVGLASQLAVADVAELDVPGVCPMCGTLPVASVVRTDLRSEGYRYLHCALCALEWHLVRVTCSHCQATKDITYHSIEGGSQAVRAESCDTCRTYRKILYQEHDAGVEPVADDLASLALDLLMSEAGYHRGSGNPLLWQSA
jgi:FdhE protein